MVNVYLQVHSFIKSLQYQHFFLIFQTVKKRQSSELFVETQPVLWYFIGAPVLCFIIRDVPWVSSWGLDNGVIAGNTLGKHTNENRVNFVMLPSLSLDPLFSWSHSPPEIGPSCPLWRARPPPVGALSATWRRAAWWLHLAGRPCGPSSGPCLQTDSGSQSAK